jgi:long-chain fatty acid transport protein
MKKIVFISLALGLLAQSGFSGGLMTNTNHSASYIRMLARDASTEMDAVYYNPAGLTFLRDGFQFSLNNQTIFQSRKIVNEFPALNNSEYTGRVSAPIFPSIYAAYKLEKFAISAGFMIVGGGGGATYKRGLPGFETQVSAIPATLTGMGIPTTDYMLDLYFEGSSVFMGAQLGVTYQFFDFLGAYAGARYVIAKNTYQGYFRNLVINPVDPVNNPEGGFLSASSYFQSLGDPVTAFLTADKEVDVLQSGYGFTPVLGLNYSPNKDLNIGFKFEFRTKLELTNETAIDETLSFPDGEKIRQDMPALISLGASYKLMPELVIALGGHYYFDRMAEYGKVKERTDFPELEPTFYKNSEIIDRNYFEVALGIQYEIAKNAFLSAGYLRAQSGVNSKYQSDMSHSLSSNSIGIGTAYAFSHKVKLNIGALLTFYDKSEKAIKYGEDLDGDILFNETYSRSAAVFAIGLDVKLGR